MNISKGMVVGFIVGVSLSLAGFFISVHGGQEMGTVLFIAVPFVTGFAVSLVTRPKEGLLAVLSLTLITSMAFLFFTQLEGLLCCILSFPILLVSMAIGAGLGILFRRLTKLLPYNQTLRILILLLLPLALQGADSLERPTLLKERTESISDKTVLNVRANKVWKQLSAIDRITVAKPWPMYVGLYEPVSCKISAYGVGATRTCYFTQGAVYEKVDAWIPPNYMHFTILKTTLPGRPWMGYVDASYQLVENDANTELRRTTTITSRLAPAWYWRMFERMGAHAVHQYLFAEIKKRVNAS